MVSHHGKALLALLCALLLWPMTAFGQTTRNFTINITLSPPYVPRANEQPIALIRYNLLRNGVIVDSETQFVSSNGPNFTYTMRVPTSLLTSPGAYSIVAYPATAGSLAIYQGQISLANITTTALPLITATRLATPIQLPTGSAGDSMLVGALVLAASAAFLLAARQLRGQRRRAH